MIQTFQVSSKNVWKCSQYDDQAVIIQCGLHDVGLFNGSMVNALRCMNAFSGQGSRSTDRNMEKHGWLY